jgi:hypothetical protein
MNGNEVDHKTISITDLVNNHGIIPPRQMAMAALIGRVSPGSVSSL